MIDRRTRWSEATATNDISATAIANIITREWLPRFGAPATISTDQGRQFEVDLTVKLTEFLGSRKIRTTAYHPQSNGKIERWHRSLKAAIMAYATDDWVRILPYVMLGLRTAITEDSGVSATRMTYGSELRLPGDFFAEEKSKLLDNAPEFVRELSRAIRSFEEKTRRHGAALVYVPAQLQRCTHVFLRVNAPRKTQQPPYTGPYVVLRRYAKTITIEIDGEEKKISIDRTKPAYIMRVPEPTLKTAKDDKQLKLDRPVRKVRFQGIYSK
jgi:hypothetical protein